MLPPKIARWLALYDHLEWVYRARDHPGVDAAYLALVTYEHMMTARDRMAARVARWRRDSLFPLPSETERVRWGECLCRTCAAARRAAAVSGHLALRQRHHHPLQQEHHEGKGSP